MLSAPKPQLKLPNGVADQSHLKQNSSAIAADDCYLPDFSSVRAVAALVLISQLVALILTLAGDNLGLSFFIELAKASMLMLWMILASAYVLSAVRPVLTAKSTFVATLFSLGLILATIAVVSEFVYWLGVYLDMEGAGFFPAARWEFLSRNLVIGCLVGAAVLRYFYVSHQWRRNVEKETQSRVTALQARIRPHFLFNSMNTIAALTRTDPDAAEQAVEDLADLFRASLSNPGESISLAQELDIARVYQRMEEQRLGSRLEVDWQLNDIPLQTKVPGLTIQPLLENAIYHGIEPLSQGGVVTIEGREQDEMVTITVSNPVIMDVGKRSEHGNRIALDNIRQRLELAYGDRASLKVENAADHFRVQVGFPVMA